MVDASAVLRQGLLQLSKSGQIRSLVEKAPVSRDVVRRFVPGERTADAVAGGDRAGPHRPAQHHRLPRRGHHRPRPGRARPVTPTCSCSAALSEAGPDPGRPGRGQRQAERGRPVPPRRRAQDRPRPRPRDLPGGRQRRHDGDPRHGGPHHHRRDAGDPARAAPGLPVGRRGAAGLPAPHRGRLPRPRRRGQPGAPVQGRLQGARVGRVPGLAPRSTSPTCAA